MTAYIATVFVLVYLGMILGGLPFLQLDRTGIALLGAIALVATEAIGVDEAWQAISTERAIQGNLDPCVLLADRPYVRQRVADMLAMTGGKPGHIFNLGHGILPQTPVDNAVALVDAVHELSQK